MWVRVGSQSHWATHTSSLQFAWVIVVTDEHLCCHIQWPPTHSELYRHTMSLLKHCKWLFTFYTLTGKPIGYGKYHLEPHFLKEVNPIKQGNTILIVYKKSLCRWLPISVKSYMITATNILTRFRPRGDNNSQNFALNPFSNGRKKEIDQNNKNKTVVNDFTIRSIVGTVLSVLLASAYLST